MQFLISIYYAAMDTLRITYKVHRQKGFYLPYKRRLCKHRLSISSDLFPGIFTYLWLGSYFPKVFPSSIITTLWKDSSRLFLESWRQLFIHFLSHWLIFPSAGFLALALRVRDPVTNKRQPLPSWSAHVCTKQSWKVLSEWMSRFFLAIPWLLCYLTRAAMTKEHGLAAHNTAGIWCPKFWRLEAQDQEVKKDWDFPGGPVAKRLWTPNARGPGLILGQGTKIPNVATKNSHATT